MFHAQNFCEDYSINWFPSGTKNVGSGWIGIQCPFCDDPSSHGGFNIEKGYYSCHRCKGHWMPKVIAALTKSSLSKSKKIIKKYSSKDDYTEKKIEYKYASKVIFPPDTGPLTDRAKQYLMSRNFDPDYLASEWGLLSTGNIGEYKFRILAPVYLKGQLISYQCRDITGKNIPYKGCPIDESVYFLKHTLYGIDKAIPHKKCIVVEGIVDSWRLGPGAVSTFSMNFMIPQVLMLARNFDEIFIMFDAEDRAQEQADKLYHQLTIGYDKKTEILNLKTGDPGSLSNEEAKNIMKEIGLL
jgi:hypothetical protein